MNPADDIPNTTPGSQPPGNQPPEDQSPGSPKDSSGFEAGGDAAAQALERYLDGLMTPEEATAFERYAQADEQLQASIRQQRSIDSALSRLAKEPAGLAEMIDQSIAQAGQSLPMDDGSDGSDDAGVGRIEPSPLNASGNKKVKRPASPMSDKLKIAVAAVCLLTAMGMWLVNWQNVFAPDRPSYTSRPRVAQVVAADFYQAQIEAGFKPDWVCDAKRFRETFTYSLKPMSFVESLLPTGAAMAGLSYVYFDDHTALVMLAEVDEEPVLVFADRAEQADRYEHDAASGLYQFKREVSGLVLIEISPRPEPVFLDAIIADEASPEM